MFTAVPAVITTRSPVVDERRARARRRPSATRAPRRHRPRGSGSASRPTRAPSAAARSRWCVSAMIGRRGRSRATAEAVRPLKVGTRIAFARERLGEVAGGVRHRLADRRLVARLGQLVAVAEARLDRACDAVHVRDRLDAGTRPTAVSPESISAERAVEHRVRDVARLGARRLGVVDHRLEHLRRGDHRLPALERRADDPLLEQRHLRRRRSRRRGRRGRPSPRRSRRGSPRARRPPRPSRSSRSRAPASRPAR